MNDPKPDIEIWGSSVAAGAGDELELGGYAGRLARRLEPAGWHLENHSLGGDNTSSLALRFAPQESSYVLIGLSLGNEGISQSELARTHRWSESDEEADETFEQFASGLQNLVDRCTDAGATAIIAMPYARSDFSPQEYAHTIQMILLINSWNAPSINMLGAIDDGQGRWAEGFWADPFHPNSAGHTELCHAFVPSLFDALVSNKPPPFRIKSSGLKIGDQHSPPLVFSVDGAMRSFSLSFRLRAQGEGNVAAIECRALDTKSIVVHRAWEEWQWDSDTLEMRPSEERLEARISIQADRIAYISSQGETVTAAKTATGEDWRDITLTHYVARGETLLYVDSELIGRVNERLQPESFTLGCNSATSEFRDWMVHRAGLTRAEVSELHSGQLLQASLELYAPLGEESESAVKNFAQSLATIKKTPRR